MGTIWKGTHLSIKVLTAESAYQSKKQTIRSKKLHVELWHAILNVHRSM